MQSQMFLVRNISQVIIENQTAAASERGINNEGVSARRANGSPRRTVGPLGRVEVWLAPVYLGVTLAWENQEGLRLRDCPS
jgi:hypothetical protein